MAIIFAAGDCSLPDPHTKTATKRHRIFKRVKQHDWFAVLVDFVIVVAGIFIGLQVNLWVQSRQDRATEHRYLERLLADSDASIEVLRQAIALNDARAGTLQSLSTGLSRGTVLPDHVAITDVLCRWFVQPAVEVRRGTYAELVSSGRLSLIHDEDLRSRLALQEAAHEEAQRLDILNPAILEAAAPVSAYRKWRIIGMANAGARRGVDCDFDLARMRGDDRVTSALAQLYRDEITNRVFRQRELAAVEATRSRLRQLLR